MNRQIGMAARPEGVFQRVLLAQMAIAEMMGVSLMDLHRDTRGDKRVAFARQVAMYLCHQVFAMRVVDLARAFGRDRSTARHAISAIEEAREDAEVDRMVASLESMLHRAGDANV